jgi:hypothetical protein
MEELKPCPFCGGTVGWCECGECNRIQCDNCQFLLEPLGDFATVEYAKYEAATRWNKRAPEVE